MSTLDPGLEPPDDWPSPYTPPPGEPGGTGGTGGTGGPTGAAAKAAVYVWVSAGAGLVMTCCCVLNVAVTLLNPQLFMEQIPSDLPPELQEMDWNQFLVGLSIILSILYMVVLLIPSIALAILGFGVRKGQRGQTIAATGLLWLFLVLAGFGLALSLFILAKTGQVATIVLPTLVIGGWLWLSLTTLSKLRAASQPSLNVERADPWGA